MDAVSISAEPMTSPRTRRHKRIETITPRTIAGIFSSQVLGVEDSEELASDKAEDLVHEWCVCGQLARQVTLFWFNFYDVVF